MCAFCPAALSPGKGPGELKSRDGLGAPALWALLGALLGVLLGGARGRAEAAMMSAACLTLKGGPQLLRVSDRCVSCLLAVSTGTARDTRELAGGWYRPLCPHMDARSQARRLGGTVTGTPLLNTVAFWFLFLFQA